MGQLADTRGTITRGGQKLIDIMLDPATAQLTALERAQKAGISLRQYHRLLADASFQAALKARALEALTPAMSAVLGAAKDTATEAGRDGFKDREMLLRMLAWYEPTERRDITARLKVDQMSDEQLAALAGEFEARDE